MRRSKRGKLHRIKIALGGNAAAGKSSLIQTYLHGYQNAEYEPTVYAKWQGSREANIL